MYKIEVLKKQDLAQVIDLAVDSVVFSKSPLRQHISEEKLKQLRRQDLTNLWDYFVQDKVGCFVAKAGDEVIGSVIFMKNVIEPFFLDKQLWVVDISVKENYRRMGVATALMRELELYAKKNKDKYISLEVTSSNKSAIKLYEKLGYIEERRRYTKVVK